MCTDDDSQCYADNNKYKRLKSKFENNLNDDVNQTQMEKEQIHLIANLLDLLEIGGSESVLGMVEVIKLAQLTVSYFFWSLYEKCKFLFYLPSQVVLYLNGTVTPTAKSNRSYQSLVRFSPLCVFVTVLFTFHMTSELKIKYFSRSSST